VDAGRPFTTQLMFVQLFPGLWKEDFAGARNRLLALLNNAGTRHWPINKFRLHRASQRWLYRSKITVIMKRLMEWLTLTCPLHEYWVTLPQRNVNCFMAPLHSTADSAYIVCMVWDRLGEGITTTTVRFTCLSAVYHGLHSLPTPPLPSQCFAVDDRSGRRRQFSWLSCGRHRLLIISHRVSRPKKNIARYRYYPI